TKVVHPGRGLNEAGFAAIQFGRSSPVKAAEAAGVSGKRPTGSLVEDVRAECLSGSPRSNGCGGGGLADFAPHRPRKPGARPRLRRLSFGVKSQETLLS